MSDACHHHWVLATPGYAASATCKLCGETREFSGGESDLKQWTNRPAVSPRPASATSSPGVNRR